MAGTASELDCIGDALVEVVEFVEDRTLVQELNPFDLEPVGDPYEVDDDKLRAIVNGKGQPATRADWRRE